MSNAVPIIFDTDLGIDDSYSLALAAASDEIRILGITTCFGNSSVANCTRNVLKMCELLQLDVPVAAGASKALLMPEKNYDSDRMIRFHGKDGLGDVGDRLPEPRRKAEQESAVELMARLVSEAESKVVLVPVGPLTNVAVFLTAYPELKDKIDGIAMMGGAVYGGNALPEAEANITADPEAAQIVFQSGVKIVMCGLDVTNRAYLTRDDREMLRLVGGKTGEFFFDMTDSYAAIQAKFGAVDGPTIHDAVPMAWLIDPQLLELEPAFVQVDLTGFYTACCTAADLRMKDCGPNAMVAMGIDRERFVSIMTAAFKKLGKEEKNG